MWGNILTHRHGAKVEQLLDGLTVVGRQSLEHNHCCNTSRKHEASSGTCKLSIIIFIEVIKVQST